MEDMQNDAGPESQGNGERSAMGGAKLMRAGGEDRGGAKLMRAGGEDRGGQTPTPGPSRDGDKRAGGSSPAPAAPVLRAGRQALKGAEGAEAAATVDSADDGGGADVVQEWVSCSKRAYIRNTQALGELLYYCWMPYGLLHWRNCSPGWLQVAGVGSKVPAKS